MAKTRTFFQQHFFGIQKRIHMILSAIFFLLIITLGLICSNYATKVINDEVSLNAKIRSQYLSNTINSYITEQKNALFYLSFDSNFESIADAKYTTEIEKYTIYKGFNSAAKSIVTPKKGCEIFAYLPNQNYLYSTDSQNTISNFYSNPFLTEGRMPESILSHFFSVLDNFAPPVKAGKDICFAVVLSVIAPSKKSAEQNTSYLAITSSSQYFDTLLKNTADLALEDFVLLVNKEYDLVYCNPPLDNEQAVSLTTALNQSHRLDAHQPPNGASKLIHYAGKEYLINEKDLDEAPWKIIILTDTARIAARVKQIYLAITAATVFICIFIYAALHLVLKKFISPIIELKQVMKKVESGDFSTYSFIDNNDEIGELSSSFNVMTSKIKDMINQVYKSRLYQREAELYALQEQINPHFLYNTLGTINSLAGLQRYQEIRHAVTTLANIFRYSISSDRHILASFKDELLYAQRYMSIQSLRFQDKLSIQFETVPAINSLYTLKLIFQPLIENSIQHGMPQDEKTLHIVVSCEIVEDTHIAVHIKNDGNPIEPEKLARIQAQLANVSSLDSNVIAAPQPHSIGIYNVNSRIHLLFGDNYGLTMRSDEKETVCRLILPIIDEKELKFYEQQDNT